MKNKPDFEKDKCIECGEVIQSGEEYDYAQSGKWRGTPKITNFIHKSCYEAILPGHTRTHTHTHNEKR